MYTLFHVGYFAMNNALSGQAVNGCAGHVKYFIEKTGG